MYKCSLYNVIVPYEEGDLLFNTYRGTLAKIDANCKSDLNIVHHGSPYKDLFVEQGFWVKEDQDELLEMKQVNEEAKFNQKEMNLTIKLTDECNFRCLYCYQPHTTEKLTSSKLRRIEKFVLNSIKDGIKKVFFHLFGGEPSLNLSIASELSNFLKFNNIQHGFTMTSNGYLLNATLVAEMERIGINSLQVTLDGPQQIHDSMRYLPNGEGTYEVILKNLIYILQNTEIHMVIRCNLSKRNAPYIHELLQNLFVSGLLESKRVEITTHEAMKHETTPDSPVDDEVYFNSRIEFAQESLKVCALYANYGKKIYTCKMRPYSCEFDVLHNRVISTNLDFEYCTSSGIDNFVGGIDDDGNVIRTEHDKIRTTRVPFLKSKCVACKVLPICMGGCALLEHMGSDSCIFIKYVLDDYVRLLYESRKSNNVSQKGELL